LDLRLFVQRPRTGVDGLFGGSGVDSVGKRFEQKNALTLTHSHESVFSERNVSVLRDVEFRLAIVSAFWIRLILTFPSALAPVDTLAERSEKTRAARIPFEIAFVLILPSLPFVPLATIGSRHTSSNYKCRANM
jgi:hypothetical protein